MIITPHDKLPFISYGLWQERQISSDRDFVLDPEIYRSMPVEELVSHEAWSLADYFVDRPVFELDGITYTVQTVTLGKDLNEAAVNFLHFLKRQPAVVLYQVYQTLGTMINGDTSKFVIKARITVLNNARDSWDTAAALLT